MLSGPQEKRELVVFSLLAFASARVGALETWKREKETCFTSLGPSAAVAMVVARVLKILLSLF